MNRLMLVVIVLTASFSLLAQQRTQQVQVESTISGNQEQPKTLTPSTFLMKKSDLFQEMKEWHWFLWMEERLG